MAHKIEILRGATTYVLNDPSDPNNPFSVEEADLGGASVRNIEESGPYQDGMTHLDYRLEPDTTTLRIFVKASSDALLDGYRDTLNTIFKPVRGMPITLKYTRDDGAVRHYDTQRAGKLSIPLLKDYRPGHTHKAVVQLRAADPTWYDPDEQEQDFLQPGGVWWLAGGNIGTADVLEHINYPTQGQLWANTGTVAVGGNWTVVFRSALVGTSGSGKTAFYTLNDANNEEILFSASSNYGLDDGSSNSLQGSAFMSAGTHNYFAMHQGGTISFYRDNVLLGTAGTAPSSGITTQANGELRWRSSFGGGGAWTVDLPNAAAYNIALSSVQRTSLHASMDSTGTADPSHTADIVYTGDYDTYPTIEIRGPIGDPVITNQTTGDVLDFTGGTVGTADTWTIDLRYGRKSVVDGAGSSVLQYLSEASDLTTFRLIPAPLAPGGTNTIEVAGDASGIAAAVTISYLKRYLSY